jgi:hypothetical protein
MTKPIAKIDLPFKDWLIVCSGINLILIVAVLVLKNNLPPQVPLLYGLAEGEEQLVPRILLTLPSLAAIIITSINFGLSFLVKDAFIKKILLATPIVVTFLATITCLKIIFLVGSL